MKRITRKPLAVLLSLALLLALIPFHAFAAETYEGWCGEDARWSYNADNNTLTISGKGKVQITDNNLSWAGEDYDDCYDIWEDIDNDIYGDEKRTGKTASINLVVEKGITAIYLDADFTRFRSVKFPDTLKRIEGFYYIKGSLTFTIPKSVTYIDCGGSGVKAFKVEKGNKKYTSQSGVLFNKDKSVLVSYPCARKATSYTIPKSVNKIRDGAFALHCLKKITIPQNVKTLQGCPFWLGSKCKYYFKGSPPKMKYPFGSNTSDFECTVYYPKSKKKEWKKTIKRWKKEKSRLANGAYFSYNNSYSLEGVAICQSEEISHEGKRHGMRSRH